MSPDDAIDADDTPETQDSTDAMDDDPTTDTDRSNRFLADPETAKQYLMWIALALLALLAVLATFRVYTSASTAIARFVAPDFRPLFQAAFNLVVLLLAVAGITTLLRELQATT